MESSNLPESAPASDTKATEPTPEQLADFDRRKEAEQHRHEQATGVSRVELAPIPPAELEAVRLERESRQAQRAEQRRRAEIHQRWTDLVLSAGERYRGCTLDSFQCDRQQQSAVVAALREFIAADSPDNVILYGPAGTGKDHLAFAVCRTAIAAGKTVQWINGQKWFGNIRDAMDTNNTEASLISSLARPDVLCLSDPLPPVGALTQHQATMLYRLIDARYSRGVPTICTVNVAGDAEGDERIGAPTWDRLCHGAWKMFCNWPSYRKPSREV